MKMSLETELIATNMALTTLLAKANMLLTLAHTSRAQGMTTTEQFEDQVAGVIVLLNSGEAPDLQQAPNVDGS